MSRPAPHSAPSRREAVPTSLFLVALFGFLPGCGGRANTGSIPDRSSSEGAFAADVCERVATCPRGYGVCVQCPEPANPVWVWNPSAGSAHDLRAFEEEPDCDRFTFDERGRPILRREQASSHTYEDTIEWSYDQRGRVTRIRIDETEMCGRGGDGSPTHWDECGPPDGKWDRETDYIWEDDVRGSTLTVPSRPRFRRRYDVQGRMIGEESSDRFAAREYGDGPLPTRERWGHFRSDWSRPEHPVEAGGKEWRFEYETKTRYDRAGRPAESSFTDLRAGKQMSTTSWFYDSHGNEIRKRTRLVHAVPRGTISEDIRTSLQYDHANRPVQTVTTFLNPIVRKIVEKSYGPRYLRRKKLSYKHDEVIVESSSWSWRRDSAGRLLRSDTANQKCLVHLWDEVVAASAK